MKKMFSKRVLSVIFSVCMIFGTAFSLAACGGGDEEQEYTPEDTITYKWLIPTQQSLSLSASKIVQKMQEKFNIVFDFSAFVPGEMFNNKKNLALTGSDEYDLISRITKDEAAEYGPDGLFIDLSAYEDLMPNMMGYLNQYPQHKMNAYTAMDEMYYFPSVKEDNQQSSLTFSIVDSQLAAVGAELDDLKTWDGFLEVLRALKAKDPLMFPFTTYTKLMGVELFMYPFVTSFTKGITGFYDVTDPAWDYNRGEYVNPFSVEGYRDAVEFIQLLYKEELIDPNHTANDGTGVISNALKNGESAVTYAYVGGLSGIYTTQQDIANAEMGELVPFPTPQMGTGKTVYDIGAMHIGVEGTALFEGMKGEKLERIIKAIDWLYSDEAYDYLYWHPDVTAVDENGDNYYKNQEMYKGTQSTVDVYLPWSMMEFFRVDYFTTYDSENELTKYRENYVLGEENEQYYVEPVTQSFTFDEMEEISLLKSKVNTYFLTNISHLLRNDGQVTWDAFVTEMNSRGTTRIVELYNQAYQRSHAE